MDLHVAKGKEPLSEEQMYELYNVNKEFRDTAKLKHNNWTTPMRRADKELVHILNHQTTLELKPKYGSLVPQRSVELLETLSKQPRMPLYLPEKGKEELLG
jgi:hypothetical protein